MYKTKKSRQCYRHLEAVKGKKERECWAKKRIRDPGTGGASGGLISLEGAHGEGFEEGREEWTGCSARY